MKDILGMRVFVGLLGTLSLCLAANASHAQNPPPPDHPAVTVHGKTYTPRSTLARNMGSEADRYTAFPPHRIIGNIYYVGTNTLSSFLVTTPRGHVLIDSTYERNVPTIEKGSAMAGIIVADRLRRKRKITMITRPSVAAMVN